jgi:hypothetical protein
MRSQGSHASAGAHWRHPAAGFGEPTRFVESSGIVPDFPWGRSMRSRGSPASASGFLQRNSVDERAGDWTLERALDASTAWRAKRGVRAVNGGPDGRRERPARGCSHPLAAGFTESSGIVPDFPWGRSMRSQGSHASAGAHWRHPAAGFGEPTRFTESSGIVPVCYSVIGSFTNWMKCTPLEPPESSLAFFSAARLSAYSKTATRLRLPLKTPQ